MANQFPRRQKDLIAALQDFIRNFDDLNTQEVTRALEEFSAELGELTEARRGPQTRIQKPVPSESNLSDTDAEPILQATMHYPCPAALSRELPALLELRGICLSTEERPALMTWLNLHVTCGEKTDSVQLVARVVQHTADGFALEIEPASLEVRTQLLELATPPTKSYAQPHTPSIDRTPYNSPRFIESEGEPLARYNLEQTELATILLESSHRRGFSLLQIQHAAHTWQIACLHHQIIDIQHFPLREAESLNGLLLESRNLTGEQFDKALEYAQAHNIEPENALVPLGFLTETQFAQAHKARIMLLLQRLFERTAGHVALFGLTYPPAIQTLNTLHENAHVSIPVRVFHHVHARYQKLDKNLLLVAAQRFNNRTLSLNESLHLHIHALNLDEKLQAVAFSLKNSPQYPPRTLTDLIQASPIAPSKIVALCLALDHVGLLHIRPRSQDTLDTQPGLKSPPEIQPEQAPTPEDHFTTLGLHWSAYDQEIQRAYHNLNQQFSANNPDTDPNHCPVLADINQAYEAIRNPAQRSRYRNTLVDSYTIETALTEFRRQAENAKLTRDIETAIDACCRIIELDPDDTNAREDLKTLRPLKLRSNAKRPDSFL